MNLSSSKPFSFSVALALLVTATAQAELPKINCPDHPSGETSEDCPWAGVARILIAEADAGRPVGGLLPELLPELDRSLRADSHRASWKALWGRSINFDEFAGAIIVHPSIVAALGEKFGNRAPMILLNFKADKIQGSPAAEALGKPITTDPAGHALVHAGLEHTYGYLLSVLKTSYGYKRARWVQGEIEQGFGLPAGLLGPHPMGGTLFANVTYFAGNLAFRGQAERLSILKKGGAELPAELRDFDFAKLRPLRLEETVSAKDSVGQVRRVVLRTDLVPFTHLPAATPTSKNTQLLIYSVVDPSSGGEQLITAFPVNAGFVELVTKAENLGEGKPVQTRYNGFIEGVTGAKLNGTRKVIRPATEVTP